MRFSIRYALPLLGVALLLAEAGIAGLGVFAPHVDASYEDYYISGARSCWLPPSASRKAADDLRVAQIQLAALGASDACFLLDGGWSSMERWGVWSDGGVAKLDLPRLPGKSRLAITVIGFSPRNRQSVTIIVNGVRGPGYFVPSGGRLSTLMVAVPPGVTPEVSITFDIKHPAAPPGPANKDQRQLGIGLIAIAWR